MNNELYIQAICGYLEGWKQRVEKNPDPKFPEDALMLEKAVALIEELNNNLRQGYMVIKEDKQP